MCYDYLAVCTSNNFKTSIYTDEAEACKENAQLISILFLLIALLYSGFMFIYACSVDWNVLVVYCVMYVGALL